ncbi:hypothetical protein [Pseudomonas phage PA5]|uniref:Uncharacterized protein n=1 Tax=Pseudomonas phage PA5 TaxID=1913570 RepID=A0A1J0MHV9_9CAUD|nr:hypothetical protein FDH19_gp053 [Pseudomonas phage PA5]APD20751.1 hypothetical protein [Pseudomonas phage PA5]
MEDLGKPSIPEFEKIDAKKLYEALETIAELEKKWDESEKRTRDLAEVERPEVVGYRSAASRMVYEKDYGLQNPEPMMLVSQHDRIVGELLTALTSMTEARNRYNNLWNCAGNRLALAQVEIRKVTSERYAALARIAELEKELAESEKRGSELAASYCDGVIGDEHGHPYCRYKVERDAALAEVERLRESKGDPSGSFDRCMKMMYERDENAKRLDAALARVAELEGKLTDWVREGFRLNEALAVAKSRYGAPEGYALVPVRETEAMHDAVMALLYNGVARTDTQKLLDAYINAATNKESV